LERYDRELKEVFALQDEITQKIVAALEVRLTEGEQEHVWSRYTDNLEAYDSFLRGLAYFHLYTKEANAQAQRIFERVTQLDPEFADAYVFLGWTYWVDFVGQWSQDSQFLGHAFALAQKAVALDDSLPNAHSLLGWIYLLKRQYDQAIAEAERAVALDPNHAEAYTWLAQILTYAGRPQEAIGVAEKAIRLDPRGPPHYLSILGLAHRLAGRYEEAIAAQKRALTRNPDFLSAHTQLAFLYSELGREEEAQAEVAEVLRINPNYSLEVYKQRVPPFKDPAELERYFTALRKAGLK